LKVVKSKSNGSEPRSYMTEALMWLGIASANRGDATGSDEYFSKALAMNNQLIKEAIPDYLPFREDRVDMLGAYGDALLKFGKTADAKKKFQESLELLKFVLARKLGDTPNNLRLALAYERLGIAGLIQKQATEAKDNFAAAVKIRQTLFEIDKNNLWRQIGYVLAMARTGERANSVRLTKSIAPRMVNSTELMLQVARCYATFVADNTSDRRIFLEEALKSLEIATRDGFQDLAVLQTDADLAPIRDEAGFKELIEKIKRRQ
jgi:tetratricopeptide (TPR) repeat protein